MAFDESYGELEDFTLRIIKRYNVSPADWDDLYEHYNGDELRIRVAIDQYGVQRGYFDSGLWMIREVWKV